MIPMPLYFEGEPQLGGQTVLECSLYPGRPWTWGPPASAYWGITNQGHLLHICRSFVVSCDIWVSAGSVVRASLCWLSLGRQSQAPLWPSNAGVSHTTLMENKLVSFHFYSTGLCLLSCCLLLLWWPSFCLFKVLIHSFFCFCFLLLFCLVWGEGVESSYVPGSVWCSWLSPWMLGFEVCTPCPGSAFLRLSLGAFILRLFSNRNA